MTDDSRTGRVEVTQADREAAREIHEGCYTGGTDADHPDDWVSQAFARHRLAALSGAGETRPTQDDIYGAFYAESAVLDEARAGAQVLTVAQFGVAVDRLLATHPGDHPGDAGEGQDQRDLNELVTNWRKSLANPATWLDRLRGILSPTSAPAGDGARKKLKPQYPDYIDDPDGLERFRDNVRRNPGHDMSLVNHNSLGRLIDTIDRLRRERDCALSTQATDREKVLEEAINGIDYAHGVLARVFERRGRLRDGVLASNVNMAAHRLAAARRALAQAPSKAGR